MKGGVVLTREQSYDLAFQNKRRELSIKTAEYNAKIEKLSSENPRFGEISRKISAKRIRIEMTIESTSSNCHAIRNPPLFLIYYAYGKACPRTLLRL